MGMITSIRAPFPVAETPAPSAPVSRPQGQTALDAAGPVAVPALAQAVSQVSPKPVASDAMLMEARMTAKSSATAAAEAAREAYIKASIAAGISPLPLS
jgi:hypothetical protein